MHGEMIPRTEARMLLIPEGVRHAPLDRVTARRSPLSCYTHAAVPAVGYAGDQGALCVPGMSLPGGTNHPVSPQAA